MNPIDKIVKINAILNNKRSDALTLLKVAITDVRGYAHNLKRTCDRITNELDRRGGKALLSDLGEVQGAGGELDRAIVRMRYRRRALETIEEQLSVVASVFHGPARRPYNGKYQGSSGVQGSNIHKDWKRRRSVTKEELEVRVSELEEALREVLEHHECEMGDGGEDCMNPDGSPCLYCNARWVLEGRQCVEEVAGDASVGAE